MFNLLKKAHDSAEELKGRKLVYTLIAIFVVFTIIGFATNYFIDEILKSNETSNISLKLKSNKKEESYDGVITYIDPQFYPQDEISFYLADQKGNELILLKSTDQKLEVSEGLFVKVFGTKQKTLDGKKDVLVVERLAVSNK